MSTWQRVENLLGSDNLKRLAEKKVGIIGLGSGGGFVALSLAMSGVGNFVLIDNDALEEGNVVRHVADRRYIGQNKARAVAGIRVEAVVGERAVRPPADSEVSEAFKAATQVAMVGAKQRQHVDILMACQPHVRACDRVVGVIDLKQV